MFEKKDSYNRFEVKKVGEKNPIETYIGNLLGIGDLVTGTFNDDYIYSAFLDQYNIDLQDIELFTLVEIQSHV